MALSMVSHGPLVDHTTINEATKLPIEDEKERETSISNTSLFTSAGGPTMAMTALAAPVGTPAGSPQERDQTETSEA